MTQLAKGQGPNFHEKALQMRQGERKALETAGFPIFSGKQTGVGMAGSARKRGLGGGDGTRNFEQGFADGVHGLVPLFGGGRMMWKEGVPDGNATQVKADNFRAGRTKGIDHLQASSPEIDVETGAFFPGELSGGQGDQAALLMSGEEGNPFPEDTRGRKKKGLCIGGASQGSGPDGNNLIRVKGTNLALKEGDLAESTAAGGGTNPAGKGDPFPEPNGIGFFVVNMKGGAGLFGEQQLEGVGAEVENGAAKREICHTKV